MAKFIKKLERMAGHVTSLVQTEDGNYYYVDSGWTQDMGYETMAFSCYETGRVKSWQDLAADWYETREEMEEAHSKFIETLEERMENYTHEMWEDKREEMAEQGYEEYPLY